MIVDINLPIQPILGDIIKAVEAYPQVVLEAPPGAGKTTAVPLALLQAKNLQHDKIIMLEPRRIAAKNAALRLAALLNEPVGQTVGYRMKNDSQCSKNTRIEVVTEGVLLRLLQNDPTLDGINCIIFDEFHERSLQSDLALSLLLESQEALRDEQPLHLLLMSASLEGIHFEALLPHAKTLKSQGKSYPIAIEHSSKSVNKDQAVNETLRLCEKALLKHKGSILVFLPGQKVIQQCAEYLTKRVSRDTAIFSLYGNLPLEKQQQAIKALDENSPFTRKVVLATDIAETSLTIDGIEVVIDSGLNRKPKFNAKTGITALVTGYISKAQALQRAGRAGRLQAGFCYRAFSETQFLQMPQQAIPEIQKADLSDCCLQLLQWGVSNPSDIPWLDAPPNAHFNQALDLLSKLQALSHKNGKPSLTNHGKAMAKIAATPRLAHLMLSAQKLGYLEQGLALAYILSERAPQNENLDALCTQLITQQGPQHSQGFRKRGLQQMRQWQRQLPKVEAKAFEVCAQDSLGVLLASAFYDRVGQPHPTKENIYLLSNGRQAKAGQQLHSEAQPFIAIADILTHEQSSYDSIVSAAAFSKACFDEPLKHLTHKEQSLSINDKNQRLVAEQKRCVGNLVINVKPLENINNETKKALFINEIKQQGLALLNFNESCQSFCKRVQLAKAQGDSTLPDVSQAYLLENLAQWLTPFLPEKLSQLEQLKTIDVKTCLLSLFSYQQLQFIDSFAPETMTLASGTKARIDYLQETPTLAVKLQEMFGQKENPRIAGGKINLQLHLLSPAKKPLQITQDIQSFWQNAYPEVKKEMRGRYPKHPWPDDPITAVATGKTKKAFNRSNQ